MKSVILALGYFKQGDDLGGCIEQTNNDYVEALKLHARQMIEVSSHLLQVAEVLSNSKEKEIYADTHHISIECDDDIAKELIDKELCYEDEYAEEEYEDEEDDNDVIDDSEEE